MIPAASVQGCTMMGEKTVEERYYGQGAGAYARAAVGQRRGDTVAVSRRLAAAIAGMGGVGGGSVASLMSGADAHVGDTIPYAVHDAGSMIPRHRLCIACSAQYCRDAAAADWVEEAPLYWEQGAPLGCTTCGEYYGREAHCDTCRCNVEGARS